MSALGDFLVSKIASGGQSSNLLSASRVSHSGLSSGVSSSDYSKLLSELLNTMQKTNSTSAYDAALSAARETNSFNAQQAEINRQFQQSSADKAMQFEAQQAEINRQFQQSSADKAMQFEERLANSTYQRAVEDLKKAGLNPLLIYQNLSGQTASGSTASGSTASGRSSSGSSAFGVKADTSSALDVERSSLDRLFSMITLNVNSALKVMDSLTGLLKFR